MTENKRPFALDDYARGSYCVSSPTRYTMVSSPLSAVYMESGNRYVLFVDRIDMRLNVIVMCSEPSTIMN